MGRLYFRIYLAVLASLGLFAALVGSFWLLFADLDRFGPGPDFYEAAAERLAPAPDLPADEQRRVLAEWRELSGYDLAIFGRDGRVIVDASGGTLARPPEAGRDPRQKHWRPGQWTHAVPLSEGRVLVAARPHGARHGPRRLAWLAALAAIALAVAISAYPVVRRLTRRLESLQASVAALGSGDLTARVPVEGHDEVARLALTFNSAAARIEALVKANRSLLANASHELRSPLARLRMGIEALPPGAGSRQELALNIKELDQLIEEILLASRLDAQRSDRAAFEPVDLVALAAEECARSGAGLEVRAARLPLLEADARLLRRMIRNLLENAVRHGGGGAVDVEVRSAPGRAEIDVSDRGPGVPDGERERIFEPFYRPPGSRERDGGHGLGLALVRQIAERHGGKAVCLSRVGGGSCFRVSLPLPAASNG